MAKLSKAQIRAHDEAVALLAKDKLSADEREFVYANWHEAAEHMNAKNGAFFTPLSLAHDFAENIPGYNVIDLCAGIGILSYAFLQEHRFSKRAPKITCVDINPDYVAIGKKLVPEADWHVGDVLDPEFLNSLGRFDTAYANPPFGTNTYLPRLKYTGTILPYKVIEAGLAIANEGTFLLPQMLCPFRFSAQPFYTVEKCVRYDVFTEQTCIKLLCNNGFDTDPYKDDWKFPVPTVEIVYAEWDEERPLIALPQNTENKQLTLLAA